MDSDFFKAIAAFFTLIFIGSFIQGYMKGPRGVTSPPHCMLCGADGTSQTLNKGSFAIEVILWLCFLLPGFIYSVWRRTARPQSCSTCGSTNIIPGNTPAAEAHKKILADKAIAL